MNLTEWMTYLGITPQQITPLFLTAFLFGFVLWRYLIRDLKTEVIDLHNATREIQLHLENPPRRARLSPMHRLDKLAWAVANSPFQLNDKGQSLANASGISALVELNRVNMIAQLSKTNPPTGLDVEQCSFKILGEYVEQNKEEENKIKEFIFKNPVFEGKEIGIEDVLFVGGILLRNEYFKVHPELAQ